MICFGSHQTMLILKSIDVCKHKKSIFSAESPRPCDTSCCDNEAATTSGVGRLVNSSSAILISWGAWVVSGLSIASSTFWAKFLHATWMQSRLTRRQTISVNCRRQHTHTYKRTIKQFEKHFFRSIHSEDSVSSCSMQTILCWFKRKIKTEISLSVSTYFCSYMIFLKCLFKSSIYSRAPFFIVVNYGFSECQKYEWRWKWTIGKSKNNTNIYF